MTDPIALVTCGPHEHGISRFGRELAETAEQNGFTGPVLHQRDPHRLAEVVARLPSNVRLVHLQVNDWLFTDSVHRADESIASFAALLRAHDVGLSLTLHDLPHGAVSRDLFLRRAGTYLSMMAAAVMVIVSSEHERLLIAEAAVALAKCDGATASGEETAAVHVIPLPVQERARCPVEIQPGRSGPATPPDVVILGFLYPGKGHREVLHALAGMVPAISVSAIGRPSAGHEDLLPELVDLGFQLGVGFHCTGFVPDAELTAQLDRVSVPIAPAEHVSASASINTWIAAGRRPLLPASRYTQELQDRMPGSVRVYQPGQLRMSVESALHDPALTHLPVDFRAHPGRREVASRYLQLLRSTAGMAAG